MASLGDPTLAGYTSFIRNVMGIGTDVLPDNSSSIRYSYNASLRWVNPAIRIAVVRGLSVYDGYDPTMPSEYARAVYNLGGDRLVNYAPDLPGAPTVPGGNPPLPYFASMRRTLNLTGFQSGVVQSTSDETDSVTMVVPEALSQLTLADLQNIKTPWGREYLAIAQQYGPSIWGLG